MMTSALLSPMLMPCCPIASVAPPPCCGAGAFTVPRARRHTSPRPGEARPGGRRDRERVGEPDLSTDERAELEQLRAEVAAASRPALGSPVLGQAAGLALLSALSPTALLVVAVYLGSARPRETAVCYLAGAVTMSVIL